VGSVEDTVRSYFKKFEAGDAAGIAELFSEDGVIMPHEMTTIRGRAAIHSTFESIFGAISMRCENLATDRSLEIGDAALAETHSTEAVTNRADNTTDTGEYRELFFLRKTAGDWRIVSYMFNTLGG